MAGLCAGFVTGVLHTILKIPALLAGILTMTALYSINIRIMQGAANIPLLRVRTVFTVFTDLGMSRNLATLLMGLICVIIVLCIVYWFYATETGAAIRATGSNAAMAVAQGINTKAHLILGLVISNGLVAVSGALIAQHLGFADVQMGIGAIVIGLASLIMGEALFIRRSTRNILHAMVLGAVLYRIVIAFVLELGMPATDLRLFTAITVAAALCIPNIKKKLGGLSNVKNRRSQ